MSSPLVGVVGAGIGGSTFSLLLARAGIRVKLFEQAPALLPVGAGIVLAPNSLCSLDRLGVLPALRKVGCPMTKTRMYKLDNSGRGRWIRDVNLEFVESKVGYPSLGLVRADIQDILVGNIKQAGPDILNLGKKITSVRQADKRVVCTFEDGTEETVDILIGADGLRSKVRQLALPSIHQREPIFTEVCVTQGICKPFEPHHPVGSATFIFADKKVYGSFPLKDGAMYWFVASREKTAPGPNWQSSGVTERDSEFIRTAFFPDGVTGEEVLKNTIRSISIGVYHQPDLPHWYHDRVALLGDAAHPMSPALGQGGNQAVIDATTLANLIHDHAGSNGASLTDDGVVKKIFSQYQATRKKVASAIVKQANIMGRMNTADSWYERMGRDVMFLHAPQWFWEKSFTELYKDQTVPTFLK